MAEQPSAKCPQETILCKDKQRSPALYAFEHLLHFILSVFVVDRYHTSGKVDKVLVQISILIKIELVCQSLHNLLLLIFIQIFFQVNIELPSFIVLFICLILHYC